MSLARKVVREQQRRARDLWRRLGKKGKRGGIACLTCSEWLSDFLPDAAERKALYHDHEQICPQLMLSSLDLSSSPPPVPARHRLAAAKGRYP